MEKLIQSLSYRMETSIRGVLGRVDNWVIQTPQASQQTKMATRINRFPAASQRLSSTNWFTLHVATYTRWS